MCPVSSRCPIRRKSVKPLDRVKWVKLVLFIREIRCMDGDLEMFFRVWGTIATSFELRMWRDAVNSIWQSIEYFWKDKTNADNVTAFLSLFSILRRDDATTNAFSWLPWLATTRQSIQRLDATLYTIIAIALYSINVHDAYDKWSGSGVSDRPKYLYNNSFYIQQTVIIYYFDGGVCSRFGGENMAVCPRIMANLSAHAAPHILRHHRNDFSVFVHAQLKRRSARRKYWNNISMNIVFLHCVRKPAIDIVVGNWDGIDTMQCAWFVVFFSSLFSRCCGGGGCCSYCLP